MIRKLVLMLPNVTQTFVTTLLCSIKTEMYAKDRGSLTQQNHSVRREEKSMVKFNDLGNELLPRSPYSQEISSTISCSQT